MKFGIKLGKVEIEGIKLENIEINTEYSIAETSGAYKLIRQIIKDAPETMSELATAFIAFEETNKQVNDYLKAEEIKEGLVNNAKKAMAKAMKSVD